MPVPFDIEEAAGRLRTFLEQTPATAIREQGETLLRLEGDDSGYALSTESGKLVFHVWDSERSLVRRVVGCELRSGRLHLQCLRFGQSQPAPLILEPAGLASGFTRDRAEFRQAVLALLQREWPQWKPVSGQVHGWSRGGMPLQRFVLHRGLQLLVCVAVSEREQATVVDGALTQALLLAEDACQRHPEMVLEAVRLILPPGSHDGLRLRLSALRPAPPIDLWTLDRSGSRLSALEPGDLGNIDSRLLRAPDPRAGLPQTALDLLHEVRGICPDATLGRNAEGILVFRLYGLEFAREAPLAGSGRCLFQFGLGREGSPLDAASKPLFHALLHQLHRQRHPHGDRRDPLFCLRPEAWIESILRERPDRIEALADRQFVYTQTPVFRSTGRDVMDMLAVRRDGTLLVYELKADENLDFPLQGLDYWLRVRFHQQRGDFERLGYFPGIALRSTPPQLILVSPALRRHPRIDALLRWISPQIPLTCAGINEEWRQDLRVVDRRDQGRAAVTVG